MYHPSMIPRQLQPEIIRLSSKYPIVSITGPRQSGKTTLTKHLFKDYLYLNLENPDTLILAKADPRSFLQTGSKTRIIIDEVQKAPELFSYIQTEVDQNQIPAQFILTGSQHLAISHHLSQSLAGRVANFTLLPLSFKEIDSIGPITSSASAIIRGFYPAIIDRAIPPKDYFRNYVSTYVERDVRQILNVGDLINFQKMLILLAGRVGQPVNYSSLASDVGVSYKTISSWLSVLETSYLIFRLSPYYKNFGKRITKNPKIYFFDTGLLCYLLSVDSPEELEKHHLFGPIFENFIISEKLKNITNTLSSAKLYFWNDNKHNEVDLIVDHGLKKEIIEIKSAQTFSLEFLKGLNNWQKLAVDSKPDKTLVYNGQSHQSVNDTNIVNWYDYLTNSSQHLPTPHF